MSTSDVSIAVSTLIYIIVNHLDYCYDDETDYGYLFMNNDIVNIFRSVL